MRQGKRGRAVLIAISAAALWGQESELSVTDPSWKGISVRFVTRVEPPGENARNRLPGGVMTDQGRAHHVIEDPANKRYFGYDLLLEPGTDGNTAQLRIEPLKFTSAPSFAVGADWTLLALPKYPVIPGVKVGDTVALDLLVNPATGQKIVDYLTLKRGAPERAVAMRLARDFTLADVELSLNQPRVRVNGKLVEDESNHRGGISGAVVWLYLEGHGRFVVSLFPDEKLGFRKNGMVTAEAMTFRDGATEYRVECSGRVAPGSGPYNLYVVHEAAWRAGAPFAIGSADKAERVVGKR